MFNFMLMPVSIHFINSLFSGIYSASFLISKHAKRTTIGIWTILFFLFQIAIFEVAARAYPTIDAVAVIINIVLIFILQILMYRKDFSKQVFVIFSFLAGKETIKYIASIVYYITGKLGGHIFEGLFGNGFITSAEKVDTYFFMEMIVGSVSAVLIYAGLLGIYLYIINKKFVRREYCFSKPEFLFLILPAICALCISVTIKLMVYSLENGVTVFIYEKSPSTLFWIPVVCFLLLLSVVITVIIFQNIIQYHDEELKRKVLENQVQQIQREVSEMQEIYSDIRGVKHDMRSHLENIAAYIATGSGTANEEVRSYIRKMENVIEKLDFTYQTGNPITDVIIHQKSQEAQKKQIQFVSDFIYPIKKKIDMYDIGIILNNALDNAIEACEKVKEERKISLKSYEKGNLFFIEVSNSFDNITLDPETGFPVTDKKDKSIHGFGLYNIQKAAGKYMGDIDIELIEAGRENFFNLTVMLYKPCEFN